MAADVNSKLSKYGLPIVCKLDAEGAEFEVIPALFHAGMLGIPEAYMIEYHVEDPGELIRMLKQEGYFVEHAPLWEGASVGYVNAARSEDRVVRPRIA